MVFFNCILYLLCTYFYYMMYLYNLLCFSVCLLKDSPHVNKIKEPTLGLIFDYIWPSYNDSRKEGQ